MMRIPKNASQPTAGPLSIVAPPNALAVLTPIDDKQVPSTQILQATASSTAVPKPQQSKAAQPPVAGATNTAKPQPPKELYYNIVGEPINPTQDK
jgi:hypothetical protein